MSSSYTPLGSYFDAEMRATRPDLSVMMDYYADMFKTFQEQGNKAGMLAAHEAGEALRGQMGYSGGPDGSQYIPLNTAPAAPSYGSLPSAAAPVPAPAYSTPAPAAAPAYTPPSYQAPVYTPPAMPGVPSYDSYYAGSGFANMEAQAKALYDTQLTQAVDSLNLQKRCVEQDADELARQAYIAYLRSRDALPQQLAAMGYSGGLSETRQVQLETTWQDQRNRIGLERAKALLTIDGAINNARAAGQTALANQLSGLQAQAQSQWNDYVRQLEKTSQDNAWREYTASYDNYWKQSQQDTDNYWRQTQLEADNYWKQSQLDYNRSQNAMAELARQQELLYQQQRDGVKDAQWESQFAYQQQLDTAKDDQWNSQFDYQQAKDNAAAEWQRLMFEYQKRQDELSNTIRQQQLLLQQAEAARKAAGK